MRVLLASIFFAFVAPTWGQTTKLSCDVSDGIDPVAACKVECFNLVSHDKFFEKDGLDTVVLDLDSQTGSAVYTLLYKVEGTNQFGWVEQIFLNTEEHGSFSCQFSRWMRTISE